MREPSPSGPVAVSRRPLISDAGRDEAPARARRIAALLAAWGLAYACYRAYYAAGGQLGMIGVPRSQAAFQAVNAAGAAVIALASLVPVVGVRLPVLRRPLSVVAWLGAVGCCMHALVDGTLRVLSLTGVHPTQLPASFWQSFDRHTADVQDLLFNEPWFFVEGLLWGALGLALVRARRRRLWWGSVVAACAAATAVGVLSGIGLIPRFHLG